MSKLIGCLAILVLNVLLGGFATQYTVEFWATYIKGAAVVVPFLPCAVAGFFLGEVFVPAAIVTWLLSFVVGA